MWIKSRIEQAIIGAVLSGQPLPPEAGLLRPIDLEHPVAGIILGDIEQARQLDHRASGAELAQQLVAANSSFYRQWGINAATLTGWSHTELSDRELAGGIRMFLRLGAENEITELTRAIQESLAWNDGGKMTDIYHRDLGAAIDRRSNELDFPTPDLAVRELVTRFHAVTPLPSAPPDDQRICEEEAILAGLMDYPGLAWTAAAIVDESTFTSEYRREIYRAIDCADRYRSGGEDHMASVMDEIMKVRATQPGDGLIWDRCAQDLDYVEELTDNYLGPEKATQQQVIQLGRELLHQDLRRNLQMQTWNMAIPQRHAAPDELAVMPPPAADAGPQLRP